MLVKVFGGLVHGIEALTVSIEVNVSSGNKYYIVGLPDTAIRESFQRIEAAFKNNGLKMPRQKIVVNMAPADLKKEGSAYDMPIAAGILAASGQLSESGLECYMIMGELSLDGTLQAIKGVLPLAIQARQQGLKGIILPSWNTREASVVKDLGVIGLNKITDLIRFFNKGLLPDAMESGNGQNAQVDAGRERPGPEADFSDVRGQDDVKRAMEVAAAGAHNILLIGPPGSGKTMLARRMPGILPALTPEESLETTRIHSVAGHLKNKGGLITLPPFRAPHHTISDIALTGGGAEQRPGEISLAHHGILFLDELPEFKRSALEVLRQPLEEKFIAISRARYSITYPAGFMLVASMNPCPCGYLTHPDRDCSCAAGAVQKYMNRVSGPLLDRIDLHVQVTPVPFSELSTQKTTASSLSIRQRVSAARELQRYRYRASKSSCYNSGMDQAALTRYCVCDKASATMLGRAMVSFGFSARAYAKVLKISRTIADLDQSEAITPIHIAEAIHYRSLDRKSWLS